MTESEGRELDRVARRILAVVREQSFTPRQVVATVADGESEDALARAALWDLIDSGALELDSSLRLTDGAGCLTDTLAFTPGLRRMGLHTSVRTPGRRVNGIKAGCSTRPPFDGWRASPRWYLRATALRFTTA